MDGRMGKASHRFARLQLKMITMSKGRPCFLQVVSVLYWIVKVPSHCMDGLTKKEILTRPTPISRVRDLQVDLE